MNRTARQSDAEKGKAPRLRARKDFIIIGVVAFVACLVVALDPGQVFEWVARHKEVQVDEVLTAAIILGTAFAIFSWRRWADVSRQVAEYQRLQHELSTMNREAALMSETDDLLQSCIASDEAYRIIIRHLEKQFPGTGGAIFGITQARDTAEITATWGKSSPQNAFSTNDCWALRQGRVHVSLASDPKIACPHMGDAIPFYAMCVPMMAQGETVGILHLESELQVAGADSSLTEVEERTVKTLAEHLALAVANLNLRETLRTQSIHDPLTGLFNRRQMEESLEREFRRALRKKSELAILMIDLDHFKRFNDSYGHEAGDAVLRALANLFKAQLRAEDTASRYGGEEFTLILPDAGLQAASECAERLRSAASSIKIEHNGSVLEGIRLSVGIACYPRHGTSAEALVRVADQALYLAKSKGRDQVVTADSLGSAGYGAHGS